MFQFKIAISAFVLSILLFQNETQAQSFPECSGVGTNGFYGCFFHNRDLTRLGYTQTSSSINFNWGEGSPHSSINRDTFSARWQGTFEFLDGDYEFRVAGDDGFRLYVNNRLELDRWQDQQATEFRVRKRFQAGRHLIRLEYYENTGAAQVRLSWARVSGATPPPTPAPPPAPPQTSDCTEVGVNNFYGCYYHNMDLTRLGITRIDNAINFNWGEESPHSSINRDTFSAKWQGTFEFQSGDYEFRGRADNIRIYINNRLELDKWGTTSSHDYRLVKSFQAGRHLIRVEYYENTGSAEAQLSWARTSASAPPPPPPAPLPPAPAPPPPSSGGSSRLFPVLPQQGVISAAVVADVGSVQNQVVSFAVPFPPATLTNPALIRVIDPATDREIPVQVNLLTRWPHDQSVRSVLILFRTTLASGARRSLEVRYGVASTAARLSGLSPNPDGPAMVALPPEWYGQSLVSGRLLPSSQNTDFVRYETQLRQDLTSMNPSFESYRVNCEQTAEHRTYYDSPHGLYQLFLRTGSPAIYRRARLESKWFRANELTWYQNRTLAVHICQRPNWNPSIKLEWYVLRRMLSQGSLDDYQLTGDPAAREALVAMGEAYLRNLPTLALGTTLEATERNLAWPLMGLASYYAVNPSSTVRQGIESLVDRAIRWQNRGTSGAFEHDLAATDPDVCSYGPRGASPFMTSLMVDALMEHYTLTRDSRIAPMLVRIARWYRDYAQYPGEYSFVYLWGCQSNHWPSQAMLNTLIVHVFGATYVLTGDRSWITYGDQVARLGEARLWTGRPKEWSQAARTFGRYLAYREL